MKYLRLMLTVGLNTSFCIMIGSSDEAVFDSKQICTRPLIIDHDGGIDDVIATTLQLFYNPERVKAISIAPADCFDKPAFWVMGQLKNLIPLASIIPVGLGSNEGINPFSDIWREDAWSLARLSIWGKTKDLETFSFDNISSAVQVLKEALENATTEVDILETGPCTNIAELLHSYPELSKKIHRIFIMGGAVYVKGNVEEKNHDGSAEWNIYNNPQAFLDVLRSGISITLISLDATQHTPIRKEFIKKLEMNTHRIFYRLVYDSLQLIKPLIDIGQYMFWDTLTSIVAINPAIVTTKKLTINVITDGPSMGKTFEDQNGFEVDVALWANQELFENTVLDILAKF